MNIGELVATLGVDDSQLKTAEQSFQRYGKTVETTMTTVNSKMRQQTGLIADVKNAIVELKQKREDAFRIEDIERYNRKIAEAEQHLREYESAGMPAEKQTDKFTESLKRLALQVITIAAAWKGFKAIMESTNMTSVQFHSTVEGLRSGLDYLMKSIAMADFSNLVEGMRDAIRAGHDYVIMMDYLASVGREYSIKELELALKAEEKRMILYEADEGATAKTVEEKIKAGEEYLAFIKQKTDLEIDLATKSYLATAEKVGKVNKLTEQELKYVIRNFTKVEGLAVAYDELSDTIERYVIPIEKMTWVFDEQGMIVAATDEILTEYRKQLSALGLEAEEASRLMKLFGRVTEEERDVITKGLLRITQAERAHFRESRFVARMVGNLRDRAFREQITLYKNFYEEINRLRKMGEGVILIPEIKAPARDYKKLLMMFDLPYMKEVEIELANIAMRNAAFGDTMDTVGQQAAWLQKRLNVLWNEGIRPGNIEMDALIKMWKELSVVQSNNIEIADLFVGVFQGMTNVISDSLNETKNVMEAFGKFFATFIKGLIMKLVAATIVAAVFAIAMTAITGGTAMTKGAMAGLKTFRDFFEFGFGRFTGMQRGGVVPSGFPHDTYPALLSSGEKVIPPGKLDAAQIEVTVKGIQKGEDIYYIVEEVKRKRKNSF